MKTIVLSIFFLLFATASFAQKKQFSADTTLAKNWYERAQDLQKKGRYDSSMVFYDQAAAVYKKYQLWKRYIDCNYKLSRCLISQGKYDQAQQKATEVMQESQQKLGPDHPLEADAYHSMALVSNYKGDSNKSLELHHKALDIRRKAFGENNASVSSSYYSIGNVYIARAEYDKALEYFQKDFNINLHLHGEEDPVLGSTYHSLSTIYTAKNDYTQALEYCQKAARVFVKAYTENHPNVATSYHLAGRIYSYLGENEKALDYYQKALQIRLKFVSENHASVANDYIRIGQIHFKRGEHDQALLYYQKALINRKKSLGNLNPYVAEPYHFLGDVYIAKGEYDQALDGYQHAIMANMPSFQDSLVQYNPPMGNQQTIYLDGVILLNSLELKADAFRKKFTKTQAASDLQLAIATYLTTDTLIQRIQQSLTSENDKLMLAGRAKKIFQASLQTCLSLHAVTGEKQYLQQAFYFAERGKANILSATLAETKAKAFAGIPDSLLIQDQQLNKYINNYTQQIAKLVTSGPGADSSKLQEYQNELFSAHRTQEKLMAALETHYPRYHQLKYQSSLVTPSQLQSVLDAQTALMEYVVSDSLLQVFVITRKSYQLHSVSLDSLFVRRLSAFRQAILSGDQDLYEQTAYPLYQTLFAHPLPKSIKELILIPEGELTTLPFEALLTSGDVNKKEYLLEKYAISYAYSASLLYERLQQKQTSQEKHLLAMAPVFEDSASNVIMASNRSVLSGLQTEPVAAAEQTGEKRIAMRGQLLDGTYVSPLLASKGEVETIASLFEQKGYKASLYLHQQAGEEKLKAKGMAAYNYIHIATHGFVNGQYPELSGLLFAQDSTSGEDGILYTGEIYNLALQAELVTLSACETGLGKLAKGEGIIGLTRALLYAGAKNVVVSFWKVPDNSTAELMGYFYKALLSGKSKGAALQQAKMKMIANKDYSHPFFWAPFILVGK
ncbi:CHAT domain-containing protein [Rhodocytophaga rosea]|uniref:CHAT domain-containing protein n=1 Tax=Rhodocytophaga rosea TaxID=2704465 RepID=A0A6C0GQ86_9BACT|nr:CHAT domain-containing protein [Rhodocytophaga rosea]QHT70238.1 CHAT domain-containing protein [Rhodocytophaga rosea]